MPLIYYFLSVICCLIIIYRYIKIRSKYFDYENDFSMDDVWACIFWPLFLIIYLCVIVSKIEDWKDDCIDYVTPVLSRYVLRNLEKYYETKR